MDEKKIFTNTIYPLSEINLKNLSYKLYICKPSVIKKINTIITYSDKLESIVFHNIHISNFTTYILLKLKVYVYGSSEYLMEETNLNTLERKNIIKPTINGVLIDTNKIEINMFKIN